MAVCGALGKIYIFLKYRETRRKYLRFPVAKICSHFSLETVWRTLGVLKHTACLTITFVMFIFIHYHLHHSLYRYLPISFVFPSSASHIRHTFFTFISHGSTLTARKKNYFERKFSSVKFFFFFFLF